MARPTSRVLALLELLQSGGTRTVAELADRLGVDERTVRRYVGHLLDLDVPVESVRGRYGGYRLAAGYRMPPLMLGDDEALAVLLGLVAGRRAGLLTASGTASETAAAKIRRMLPERLTARLDALLAQVAFTGPARETAAPDAGVLLALADAVQHRRPVRMRYVAGDGRRSERMVHPYGLVAHAGRWYVSGLDVGGARSGRSGWTGSPTLDRCRARFGRPPGTTRPNVSRRAGQDPVSARGVAAHRATVEQIRTRLPASVATIEEPPDGVAPGRLRAERLDWVPGVLALLDRPFVIERPDELRDLVRELAGRLARSAEESGGS